MPDDQSTTDLMRAAITEIDARLGKGYSITHPELITAFMLTAALGRLIDVATQALDLLRTQDDSQ